MPLFLTHHPWPAGTMSREEVLGMVHANREVWEAGGCQCYAYLGTLDNGDGWSLLRAPDRETLLRLFDEHRIPYLQVTEVWQLGLDELDRADGQEVGSRVI